MELMTDERVDLALNFEDTIGSPANYTGPIPIWSVDDPTVLTIVIRRDDNLVIEVDTTGKLGPCQVTAIAGELSATYSITVVPGPPVRATITPGIPYKRIG